MITFPQSIIDSPSLLDVNGDGLIDFILVQSKDGYWIYRICIQRGHGIFSSPFALMFIGFLFLIIATAVLYNHRQSEDNGRRWSNTRSIKWLGLRSSEKDD
jgi:hypothetical protein